MPVSILVLTLNEEANLPTCLSAVGWCDDSVMLDPFSQYNTVHAALGLPAPWPGGFPVQA